MMLWPEVYRYLLTVMVTGVLAAGIRYLMAAFPGRRRRWIFARKPCWPVRWLCGDLGPSATFWQGGPLAAGLAWWVCMTGYGPAGHWLWLAGCLWAGGYAVALINATRKSALRGGQQSAVALVTAVFLVVAVRAGWLTVMALLAGV